MLLHQCLLYVIASQIMYFLYIQLWRDSNQCGQLLSCNAQKGEKTQTRVQRHHFTTLHYYTCISTTDTSERYILHSGINLEMVQIIKLKPLKHVKYFFPLQFHIYFVCFLAPAPRKPRRTKLLKPQATKTYMV